MNDVSLTALFFSSLISSTLFPGGSEFVLAYLAQQHTHNSWLLWTVATAGNTLGGMITWGMGRWAVRYSPQRLNQSEKYQKAAARLQRWGSPALLFSWLPIVGDPLCLVAGWLKTPLVLSLFFIVLGKGLRYLAIIGIV